MSCYTLCMRVLDIFHFVVGSQHPAHIRIKSASLQPEHAKLVIDAVRRQVSERGKMNEGEHSLAVMSTCHIPMLTPMWAVISARWSTWPLNFHLE